MHEPISTTAGLSVAEKKILLAQLLQEKAQRGTFFPLSHGQRGFWFQHRMDVARAACNICLPSRIRSRIDVAALERCMQQLVDRHPSLRTTFEEHAGQLLQHVEPKRLVAFEVIDAATWTDAELNRRLDEEIHRPFDLEQGPLLRFQLLTRAPEDHIFLAVAHHIVLDYWSLIVLLDEVHTLYPAEREGRSVSLLNVTAPYSEFVRWQSDSLSSPQGEQLRRFWEGQLADVPHGLELPTDFPRPPVFSHRGRAVPCHLSADLLRGLAALAARERVTLHTVMLAAFQLLLSQYTQQREFVVGAPFSGRTRPGFEQTVGCFVNLIPLRTNLDGSPTFRQLLERVRTRVMDALEHQDFPFSQIVEALEVRRDPSRPSLVQVSLILEKSQRQEEAGRARFLFPDVKCLQETGGLLGQSYYVEQRTCQHELELVLEQCGGAILGMLRYATDLFSSETAHRMVRHFQTLLASVVADPDDCVWDLRWFSEAERRQVLVDWSQTQTAFPPPLCVHELFARQVARTPDAVAVSCGDYELRYAELDARADAGAQRLREWGVGPGRRVALYYPRSPEMAIALLATFKAGGIAVPLDPKSPPERLRRILTDVAPTALVVGRDLPLSISPEVIPVVSLEEQPIESPRSTALAVSPRRISAGSAPAAVSAAPGDVAYVVYTSGSTGQPKGVMVEHRAIGNTLYWRHKELPLAADDRVLLLLPCFFDASLCILLSALTGGAELVLSPPGEELNPTAICDRIIEQRITVLPIVPRLLQLLLNEPRFPHCRSLRQLQVGGEAMPAGLPERVFAQLDVELINLYGPTETAVEATYWRCLRSDRDSSRVDVPSSERERQEVVGKSPLASSGSTSAPRTTAVPIGRPIANVQAYVLDAAMRPLPVGVPGEIHIGGAGLACGYLNDARLTAERFVADPFRHEPGARLYRTGDRGRWRADGALEFLGRLDDQVKIAGHRVELGEIEHAISSHPAVQEAAVIAVDAQDDYRLVAYVVPRQTDFPPEAGSLQRFLVTQLPTYMLPSVFEFVPRLPRTPTGKLDRRALPQPQSQPARGRQEYVAPRTPLERFLVEVWCDMLHSEQVGVEDSFFELGGSSILGAMLVSRLQDRLGQRLHTAALFDLPNVSRLARYLAETYPEAVAERFGVESLGTAGTDRNGMYSAGGTGAASRTAGAVELLVPLQTQGPRRPLFLVHPPGGIVVCYQPLAHHLGRQQPLYALRARGLHGEECLPERLEDMAVEYIQALRAAQAEGPYRLGGWSLGGVVAFEMAQQLRSNGEAVELLALFDTTVPFGPANRAYTGEEDRSGEEYGLALTLEQLGELNADEQLPYLWQHARTLGVLDDQAPQALVQQVLDDLKRLFHLHVRLASQYAIRPYPGDITLFRPAEAPVRVVTPPDRGWNRLADSVRVFTVPGQHHTMLKEPHVEVLARHLRNCLQ